MTTWMDIKLSTRRKSELRGHEAEREAELIVCCPDTDYSAR